MKPKIVESICSFIITFLTFLLWYFFGSLIVVVASVFFFVIIIIIIGIEMGSKTCEKLIYNLCPIFYNRIGHKWQSEHFTFPWHHEILYVDVVLMPYLIASFFKYIILVTNAQSKRTFKQLYVHTLRLKNMCWTFVVK